MTEFDSLLVTLVRHEVAFIVVGGAAAIAHGSARLTQDLDIAYERSLGNLDRLVAPRHQPCLRGAPPGLPFRWERGTLERGLNFTLATTLGDVDLVGEIPGGGSYHLCLNLAQLIRAKRAAGRPKYLEALAELEAIEEEGY